MIDKKNYIGRTLGSLLYWGAIPADIESIKSVINALDFGYVGLGMDDEITNIKARNRNTDLMESLRAAIEMVSQMSSADLVPGDDEHYEAAAQSLVKGGLRIIDFAPYVLYWSGVSAKEGWPLTLDELGNPARIAHFVQQRARENLLHTVKRPSRPHTSASARRQDELSKSRLEDSSGAPKTIDTGDKEQDDIDE